MLWTCALAFGHQGFALPARERPAQTRLRPTVKTEFSTFLAHAGGAYVPSATFPIKTASVYERFYWSPDGSQLAIVSDSSPSLPGAQLQKLAQGDHTPIGQRLGIWNRHTGRIRDVVVPNDPTMGFDKVFFLGRSLLFTTFSKTTPNRLWIAPESGKIQPVSVEKLTGGATYTPSRRRPSLLVVDGENVWLIDTTQTRKLPLPDGLVASTLGLDPNDRAVIRVMGEGRLMFRLVDFETGKMTPTPEAPVTTNRASGTPFVLDAYVKAAAKGSSSDERAPNIDNRPTPVSSEDGGFQFDLVESTGAIRRRIRLAIDAAQFPVVSENGLAFAFVSNGVLMARYMVRTDTPTTKQLLGLKSP